MDSLTCAWPAALKNKSKPQKTFRYYSLLKLKIFILAVHKSFCVQYCWLTEWEVEAKWIDKIIVTVFFCFLLCFFFIFRHRNLHTSLYIWLRKTYSNIILNFSRVLYQKQHIRMNGKRLFCYVKCGPRIFGVYRLVQDTIVKQRLHSWSPDVKANQKWFNLCSVLLFLLVLSDLVFDKVRHLKEC